MGERVVLEVPPAKLQWPLPSCMSCAVTTAVEAAVGGGFQASPLFLFYNSNRLAKGRTVMLEDVLRSAQHQGVCDERLWPYQPDRATQRPPDEAYGTARRSGAAFSVRSVDEIVDAIGNGHASVIKYDLRLLDAKGLPVRTVYGSHTSAIIGYDRAGLLIVRNSWGKEWGRDGNFEMTYEEFGGRWVYGQKVVTREYRGRE